MGSCQNLFGVPCATGVLIEDKFVVYAREVYRLRYLEVGLKYPIGARRFQVVNICHQAARLVPYPFQNLTAPILIK